MVINMKKITVKTIAAAMVLMLLFSLSACGGASAFVGTWVSEDGEDTPNDMPKQLSFYSNGTMVVDEMDTYDSELDIKYDYDDTSGTYFIENGKLIIDFGEWGWSMTLDYEFNGSKLTLTDDDLSVTYYKE